MQNQDYLMHHGREGQKWGVLNGPPYPLIDSKGNRITNKLYRLISNKKDKDGKSTTESKIVKNYSKFEEGVQNMTDEELDNHLNRLSKEERALAKVRITTGLEAVKSMSNSELERAITNMTDEELSDYLTRINREQQVRSKVKTAEDLVKEKQQKEFNNRQSDLNDARSIANDTANLARNMKNLSSNKSTKSYINPKDIDKMTDDELRAATVRAQLENNYLTATNQTMQKGKKAIDWDKIANIAGIAATVISIASSVSAIRNRKDQNG